MELELILNNRILLKILFLTSLAFYSVSVFAVPSHVIIIRHAEKPENEDEDNTLSAEGERRAVALVNYVKKSPDMKKMGLPQFIFAASPKKEGSSIRSIQTAIPLSKDLNININTDYTRDEYDGLVKELLTNSKYNKKTIFIVWAHKRIVKMARALGAKDTPDEWEDDEYDRAWVLHFENNKSVDFENIKQNINVH